MDVGRERALVDGWMERWMEGRWVGRWGDGSLGQLNAYGMTCGRRIL